MQIPHNIVSEAAKRAERQKAIKVLEKAKLIPRKAVFLKQGECQFSRELKKDEQTSMMLISRDAAAYLNVSYQKFSRRIKIPFVKKKGNNKYFRISDLDKYKTQPHA
jgi:hypothetical protein